MRGRWVLPVVLVLGFAAGYVFWRAAAIREARAHTGRLAEYRSAALDGLDLGRLREVARGANIVLCVIDAARADHVGCYGYPRETTPNIDRLAREGIVFENHFAQFPETKPSTASLFTGQHPDTHLAYGRRALRPDTFTLAGGLRAAGYHTALFSQNEYASPLWGLGGEFDGAYYEPDLRKNGLDIPLLWRPEALLDLIGPWLAKKPAKPFFAYVHFMPPHNPYLASPEMKYSFLDERPPGTWEGPFPFDEIEPELRGKVEGRSQRRYVNLYDGNLRYADWAVGELERLLRETGLFEKTIFAVTSDHGEAFGEHGYWGHTFSAFDESIHIPLVVRLPGSERIVGRVSGLTQTVDLLPTLCDLLDIPFPEETVQGRSVLPLVCGEAKEVNEHVFARAAGQPPSYVVRDHTSMLLLYEGGELRALYDLEQDPRALKNVIDAQPERTDRLLDVFRAFARKQTAPPLNFVDPEAPRPHLPEVEELQVTDEMRRSLKALGYLK